MSESENKDEVYMRRCLQIAANGLMDAKPNPSVGAVIVSDDDRIIGEGYTSAYGGSHAEVNAFASVKPEDEHLLHDATMYVSLEPCSHYGHTPPCCDLIIKKGVKRVVCGCIDPFAKVQGRGIRKIREAGIEVTVNILEKECIGSNKRFMTFNKLHRPYIILKWAQTANGMMGLYPEKGKEGERLQISTPFTHMLVHKLRAENDAILIGRRTLETDKPRLNVREWTGDDPERIILSSTAEEEWARTIDGVLRHLYDENKQSLIVEGGARTLQSFIDRGLWDEIRVEINMQMIAPEGVKAPAIPADSSISKTGHYDSNIIVVYERKEDGNQ